MKKATRRGRLWAVVPALAATAALLAGCTAPAAEQTDGPITLTWWDYYGASDTIRGIAVEDALARYTEEHPDVTFERRNIPRGDYTRTLLQSATSGDGPDIAIAANWETAGYAEAGLIADLSSYVDEWGQQDEYYPAMWELTQYDDKTYAIPHFADVYGIWYNKTIFEEAGLEPPTTWEEMGETAAALSDGTRYGLAFSAVTGSEGANAFIIRAIGAGIEPDAFDTADGLRAAEQWSELVASGAVSPGALNWTEDDAKDQFISGNAAMMINSATYVAAMATEAPDLQWGVVPMPVDKVPATLMQSDNLTVGAGTEHEAAAWDVIEWFQTPEALNAYLPERGKLPAREDVASTPQWQDDPVFSVFTKALPDGWAPTGKLAVAPEFFPNVQMVVQAALSGGDIKQALADLDAKTAVLLAE
jgi:multiple sugar transport system substrate-binding protein